MKIISGKLFLFFFLFLGTMSFCLPNSPTCHQSSGRVVISQHIEKNDINSSEKACSVICICSMTCFASYLPSKKINVPTPLFLNDSELLSIHSYHLQEVYQNIDRPPIA